MASNVINGTTSNAYIICKIEWSSTPSAADNSSAFKAALYYRRTNTNTGTATNGTGTFGISVDGVNYTTTNHFTIPNDNTWVKAIEVATTIKHGTDGTKKVQLSASGSIATSSLTATYCSGEATLDYISRKATITSAPNFTDEENPTITYSNPTGTAVESLKACLTMGDFIEPTVAWRDISKTGTSYTFNLTDAERTALHKETKGATGGAIFLIKTVINGIEELSMLSTVLTIVNGNPIFTSNQISYEDMSAVADITENPLHIVQNQSYLAVTVADATPKKQATISKYEITVNGVTEILTESGTAYFNQINSSSDIKASVKVTDSRGFTTTAEKTITMLAWSLPTFTVSLERLNNYEDETHLKVDASVSYVNGKNTTAITYQYKENGGEYGSVYSIANRTQATIQCDKNKAYVFKVTVIDAFDSVTNEFALSKGKFPLFIDTRKNAIGINDFPAEREALRVSEGVARINDGIVLMGGNTPYLITVTESGTLNITIWNEGE